MIKSNESQSKTEQYAEAVSRAILNVSLIRCQGLQQTLDHYSERGDDRDLMKLADRADEYLCRATEALRVLNYALTMQIKHESEQERTA